jgi:hypothetical protein
MNFKYFIAKKFKDIIKNWSNIHTIALFFIIFFLIIVRTLFEYTVLDYDYYVNLADAQQKKETIVPVNR